MINTTVDLSDLRPYQRESFDFCTRVRNPYLNMDCGLGKSLVGVKLIQRYRKPTLVVAPKNVALYTWPEEFDKWDLDVPYQVICGTVKQRFMAVGFDVPVHVISYSNLAWLVANCPWKWQFVILDEISFLKSSGSTRFRAFKKIRPKIGKVVGMSATPAVNHIEALWAQYYCLDMGKTLSKFVTHFRNRYLTRVGEGYGQYVPRRGARRDILAKVKPSMLSIRAEDHLDQLPKITHQNHYFTMQRTTEYEEMERDSVITDLDILAGSAGVKSMKLRQLASGFIYATGAEETHVLSDDKINAFDEVYQSIKQHQVLVFYQFEAERNLLLERYEGVTLEKGGKDMWNSGYAPMLVCHPQSAGHGLNMQESNAFHVIWFSSPWDGELYLQGCGRLRRSGNERERVISHRIIAATTIEMRVHAVLDKRLKEHEEMMT